MNLEFGPSTIETQRSLRPVISTESVNGVTIGRAIVPIRPFLLDEKKIGELSTYYDLLGWSDTPGNQRLVRSVVFNLNNNTAMNDPELAFDRPVSAYFTLNVNDRKMYIEWGKIDPNNNVAKLHTFLNNSINYRERVQNGMKLSSGHIAKLKDGNWSLALLDNLPPGNTFIEPSSQMGKIVYTLYSAGFIPLSPDGHITHLGRLKQSA